MREKSINFCAQVWKDSKLKRKCELHILMFSRLGQIRRYALIRRGVYVRMFPHTVVLFWIMLKPYIEERRKLTGEWWGEDFMDLTAKCLKYLLKKRGRSLWLFDTDRIRKRELEITTSDLRLAQTELKAMRAAK
jgi:hypothetical protein